MKKKAVVVHSGGMDSSICLALAKEKWGKEAVVSLTFAYNQRHRTELFAAANICSDWGIEHITIELPSLGQLTENALMDQTTPFKGLNTLVVGRNGLMARLGAIYADRLEADVVYMGIVEVETSSGYRDCSRYYMDLVEQVLRIDLDKSQFQILTPLVFMTKAETLEVADQLGVLNYLLENTISCYEGLSHPGCTVCPACKLRNAGLAEYSKRSV